MRARALRSMPAAARSATQSLLRKSRVSKFSRLPRAQQGACEPPWRVQRFKKIAFESESVVNATTQRLSCIFRNVLCTPSLQTKRDVSLFTNAKFYVQISHRLVLVTLQRLDYVFCQQRETGSSSKRISRGNVEFAGGGETRLTHPTRPTHPSRGRPG